MTDPVGRRDDDHDPQLFARLLGAAARPYAGWVFVAAGGLLILLGYLGVSRESLVAKQLPYLISGGIGGVLLAVIGAYFLGTEELRKDGGRLERLERQVAELHAALLTRPDAPTRQTSDALSSNGSEQGDARLVALDSGETVHSATCPLVGDKAHTEVSAGQVRARGLRPCPVCEPSVKSATGRPTGSSQGGGRPGR